MINNFWDSNITVPKPYQMGPQKHRLYILNLLKKIGVKSLLDVGCGTGPIFVLNKKFGFKYKGTDYSEGMIESCKEQFPKGDFEVEDARHLTEADDSWDCVLLLHSLDHINDYKAAIKEATRVSNEYVCIVLWRTFADDHQVHMNDVNMMERTEEEGKWPDTYLMQFDRESLEKEFKKNKLEIVKTVEGSKLDSDHSRWNFMFLCKKQ